MLFIAKKRNPSKSRQNRPLNHALATDRNFQEDLIGLIGFHDQGFVMAKPTSAFSPWLQNRTANLHQKIAGSGTNITDGLRVALQLLAKAPRTMYRRIWLLSDGYPNRDEASIDRVVADARFAWTNINTIGFGEIR